MVFTVLFFVNHFVWVTTLTPHSFLSLKVHNYQRLTPFSVLDQAVESLDNLRPGDCVVCFSKNDIYSISRQIEARGLECAVIYGSLPPGEFVCKEKIQNVTHVLSPCIDKDSLPIYEWIYISMLI